VTNKFVLPALVLTPLRIQAYFLQTRRIETCSAEDGRMLGHVLMEHVQSSKTEELALAALANFAMQTAMLRDSHLPHLNVMLRSMLFTSKRDLLFNKFLSQQPCTQDPSLLTAADAATIGRDIRAISLGHIVPADVGAEVFAKYAVLRIVAQQSPWLQPMLEVVLARLMERSLEAKLRLALATSLSWLDMVSDFATMLGYFLANGVMTALLILGTVCANLFAQSCLVLFKNKHRSFREIVKEIGIVMLFLKPLVDLRRLMRGYEVDGAPFDTSTERTYCRAAETIIESIPGSIIQLISILLSGQWSWLPLISIMVPLHPS
jgi:hypothetical protein